MVEPRQQSRSASSSPSIGPVRRFGAYTLVKKLATGGMAEIWLARQRGLAGFNRFVVIKKILAHLAEQKTFREMFLDEARTCAALSHPNIVQVYDLGQVDTAYFIAMEFIAGENLAAIAWRGMKRKKPFPPYFAARVIADACKALHYAHHLKGTDGQALQIVHRDISPQNVLVTYEGEVKIVDFGIAKAASKNEQTKTGMLKGKFSYMSPEQCLGSSVDMRSDIFALGILLYELCTGKRLFKHESELMILEMITKRSVVAPSQVAPVISAGLEDIIMRALEKDPRRRFQNAQAMQFALEEYIRDEGHQGTNADIAGYMRALFGDKIEEKRRLREIASREDFEARFGAGSEEITEGDLKGHRPSPVPPKAGRVRTAPGSMMPHGRASPAQPVAGAHAATGSLAALRPGHGSGTTGFDPMAAASAGTPPSYASGYLPPEVLPAHNDGWVAPIVIAVALVVIMVASFILFQQVNQPSEAAYANPIAPPPQGAIGSLQTGKLTLKSTPKGAAIYLDGQPMYIREGEIARTPSDLSVLQYGRSYRIRLVKEGFEPFETAIVLNENDPNPPTVAPNLTALPGWLIAEVRGPHARDVRVYFDGEDVGLGPRIRRRQTGHRTVRVKAELAGMICRADPPEPDVRPNRTVYTAITCVPPRARTPAKPTRVTRRRKPRPAAAAASSRCVADPNLPKGKVTISTVPHATIYWKGRAIGESPLAGYKLPSGCIELEARHKDEGLRKRFEVVVVPNTVRVYKNVPLK